MSVRARAFLVVSVRGSLIFCVSSYVSALARRDYVDEDTSWHFAIGTRQSQDSMATRCPCALNKCENSACATRVDDIHVSLTFTSREASFLRLRLQPRSTSLSFLFPPSGIRLPFSVSRCGLEFYRKFLCARVLLDSNDNQDIPSYF